MNVEIVTIGDELLLGFTIDTNAAHLARQLAAIGVQITRRQTCGDSASEIATAVREALDRTGAVITTGGLGPTSDDMTKESIAAIFGRTMERHDDIIEALRARWKAWGRTGDLPVSNYQQAMIPAGARILTNNHGSAPGIWLEDERGRWVAMLPGVPREMRGMLADSLLPLVRERVTGEPTVIVSRTIRTTGVGESAIADSLGPLARNPEGVGLAYLPGWEGVDLRLTSRGRNAADAAVALERAGGALLGVVAHCTYGEGDTDLAAMVLDLLRERGWRIALAESCTGGMLGARLTAIPGSSDVVLGGVIAYANGIKEQLLDVHADTLRDHGAVSEETAREMAEGAARRTAANVAVSITGIAGPGGGSPEKPVGTVCFGLVVEGRLSSTRAVMVGDRDEIRRRAAQAALNLVRKALQAPPTAPA
jgi:nicotinamide-nucleotide amidase